ncbi:MAG TPA: APC family permease [Acidimicrobiales bacterium]|nr:APC family permease [Acidimicrobiales bacterium]
MRRTMLRRDIGFIGLIWASTGSIIGSGWLFTPQGALQTAGPAAIISWAIGGVAILILALSHAELGGMYPVSGGTARFPHYAFGGLAGGSFGWFSWLQAVTVAPIEVLAAIQYGQHWSFAKHWEKLSGNPPQHVLTGAGIVAAIVLMAVFVTINFLSVRRLTFANNTATWWKIGVPLLTIFVLAIVNFHKGNFTAADGFNPYGAKGILSAVSTSGIIFSLLGFEQADQLAGESANPKRDIPRAVIGSTVIGSLMYIVLQVVFLAALPPSYAHGKWATAAFSLFTGPFAQVATLAAVGWLATILYIDAVVSPSGTGLIYVTATSRVSYGLSRNGYFPSAFEWTDRQAVPWVGLITAFVAGCICFLPFPGWRKLVGLITGASVLMYAGAPLALGAFRRRLPDQERPYRMPGASVLAPAGFAIASLLILWSGWDTVWKLGVGIGIGYVILVANRMFRLNPVSPVWDVRAASWLPFYLIGMGVLEWGSTFGPMKHPWFGTNAVWWDIVVVVAFSLVIYSWAMYVSLPAEKIREIIGSTAVPEEAAAP